MRTPTAASSTRSSKEGTMPPPTSIKTTPTSQEIHNTTEVTTCHRRIRSQVARLVSPPSSKAILLFASRLASSWPSANRTVQPSLYPTGQDEVQLSRARAWMLLGRTWRASSQALNTGKQKGRAQREPYKCNPSERHSLKGSGQSREDRQTPHEPSIEQEVVYVGVDR